MAEQMLEEQSTDIQRYLATLRRRWMWMLGTLLIIVGLVGFISTNQEPSYRATAQVLISTSAAQDALERGATNTGILSRELSNEINLAESDAVKDDVEDQLGDLPNITIASATGADVLRFIAIADDPDDAAEAANTWAQAYVDRKRTQAQQSITSAVDDLQAELVSLREERQQVREPLTELEGDLVDASEEQQAGLEVQVARLTSDLAPEINLIDAQTSAVANKVTELQVSGRLATSGTAEIIQVASPPLTAANSSPALSLILGTMLGLIAGAAVAIFRDSLDKTVSSSDDIIQLTGLPVLGTVPHPARGDRKTDYALATMTDPHSPIADSYNKIRTGLQFARVSGGLNTVLVTSANQSEGKTTTSANLAWSFSTIGHRVILADVDFRRPRLHDVYGCEAKPGITNVLLSDEVLDHAAVRILGHEENFVVLPSGDLPPNPADFVASPPFERLISDLGVNADLVILDAPPVLPVSDALSLARNVDGVLLVAMADKTTKDQLKRSVANIQNVGGKILGIVLVGAKNDANTNYGYYRYKSDSKDSSLDTPTAAVAVATVRSSPAEKRPSIIAGTEASQPAKLGAFGRRPRGRRNDSASPTEAMSEETEDLADEAVDKPLPGQEVLVLEDEHVNDDSADEDGSTDEDGKGFPPRTGRVLTSSRFSTKSKSETKASS